MDTSSPQPLPSERAGLARRLPSTLDNCTGSPNYNTSKPINAAAFVHNQAQAEEARRWQRYHRHSQSLDDNLGKQHHPMLDQQRGGTVGEWMLVDGMQRRIHDRWHAQWQAIFLQVQQRQLLT